MLSLSTHWAPDFKPAVNRAPKRINDRAVMSVVSRRATCVSRRTFLLLALGIITALGTGGWLTRRVGRRAAERYYREIVAFPQDTPAGPLTASASATLKGVAVALLPPGVATSRYEGQFRWRATNRAGYRDLYERFAIALDRAARDVGQSSFVDADLRSRQLVLQRLAYARRVVLQRDFVGAFRLALFERDWLLFERYVTRDIIALFAQTDAWLMAGYPAHPGMARGLDSYRQPLPSSA
jgi:hypothetical protein